MFERFTERARQVVVLAQEEARLLKHNYIGTEHLLLGLIREEEGVAAGVLANREVTLQRVREQTVRIIGPGEEAWSGQIPFTPRAKRVLELALRESHRLGHNYIGTEHLLLGILAEGEGVAARILLDLGLHSATFRAEVLHAAEREGPPPAFAAGAYAEESSYNEGALVEISVLRIAGLVTLCLVEISVLRIAGLVTLCLAIVIATGALVALGVLKGERGSHDALAAGVLAGSAFGPALLTFVQAIVAWRLRVAAERLLEPSGPLEAVPLVATAVLAVALAATAVAIDSSAATIALAAPAGALAVVTGAVGFAAR